MGSYLETPNKKKETESGQSANKKVKYVATGMQGWRIDMEDAHLLAVDFDQDSHLFGVFDGHGGQEIAVYMRELLPEYLKKNKNYQEKKYAEALKEVFIELDNRLPTEEGKDDLEDMKFIAGYDNRFVIENEPQAGCTANVVLIVNKAIYVANAGDARSVLCIGGKAKALSQDHKPNDPAEIARIEKAGGTVDSQGRVEGGLNISRAIGDWEYKKVGVKAEDQKISPVPDVLKHDITGDEEFIVIGCDGIWEKLDRQQMCDFIKSRKAKGIEDAKIAEELLDSQLGPDHPEKNPKAYGTDNMTCVIVTFVK